MIKILMSGGIDSFVMAAIIRAQKPDLEVHGVFINYGQPAAAEEIVSAGFACMWLGIPFRQMIVEIDSTPMAIGVGRNGPRVIPNRNKTFIEKVSLIEGTTKIAIGCIKNDFVNYKDCRRSYLDELESKINKQIITPLINLDKHEIIKLGISEYGLPLHMTFSCYQPIKNTCEPCGECNSCRERKHSMKHLDFNTYKL